MIRALRSQIFDHLICTILTNVEEVVALIVSFTKGYPTTVTLSNCQLHFEREVTEYSISTTPTKIIYREDADVISSSGKLVRATSIGRFRVPFTFLAERIKECQCVVSREIRRISPSSGCLIYLPCSATSCLEKEGSSR